MNEIKFLTYSLDFALSNKYLELIKQCLIPQIFNQKVGVIYYNIKKLKKTLTFSSNKSGFRHCMVTLKNIFDRTMTRLYRSIFLRQYVFLLFFVISFECIFLDIVSKPVITRIIKSSIKLKHVVTPFKHVVRFLEDFF